MSALQLVLALVVVLALFCSALGTATESIKLANRDDIKRVGRAPAGHVHELMLVTKQRNQRKLEALVLEISDPKSKSYGNHLSRKEIADMTVEPGLPARIVKALNDVCGPELVSAHVESFGDYVIARAPVRTWERLLSAEFYHFDRTDPVNGEALKPIVRALKYTIPAELSPLVESIQNTVQLPGRSRPQWNSPSLELDRIVSRSGSPDLQCDKNRFDNLQPPKKITEKVIKGFVTPQLLNTYYNFQLGDNKGNVQASQAMYESDGQNYSPTDLLMFQNAFGIYNKTEVRDYGHFNKSEVCEKPPSPCGEANLDIQYMMAVSQYTPTSYIAQNGNSTYAEDFWMVIFLRTLMNMTAPPLVNSVSYGSQESQQSLSSIMAFETAAMKLAAMGVTVVISAGDDGVHDSAARSGAMGANLCGYSPSYPATSQWVVAVGAVQGPESGNAPSVCSGAAGGVITGGGGFSDFIDRSKWVVDWQKATIDSYFQKLESTPWLKPAPGYNLTGRAYPDVSLLGYNYITYQNRSTEGVSGTSASAPTFAAMVSLINAERRSKVPPLPSVGWITRLIWEEHASNFDPQGTYDVKIGNNKCTATSGSGNVSDTCQIVLITTCCSQGFHATDGWDPASGFGGLDFGRFKAYFSLLATMPTLFPTAHPTPRPTNPTANPTAAPTHPTAAPTALPTRPTAAPTVIPTARPSTKTPTTVPSAAPTTHPTKVPTLRPTPLPGHPTNAPTPLPTTRPSPLPTATPTRPTVAPTVHPTTRPSPQPSSRPTPVPSAGPTVKPGDPSAAPTVHPTAPSPAPSAIPTVFPTAKPTSDPTHPSAKPSPVPTQEPTKPTPQPTAQPTPTPSADPTVKPGAPSMLPSARPTVTPSTRPTPAPSPAPSAVPSPAPSAVPHAVTHEHGRRLDENNEQNQPSQPTEEIILKGRNDLSVLQRANGNQLHQVVFALRQQNLDKLQELHTSVFGPRSEAYLRYPSHSDIVELTIGSANEASLRAFLLEAGVSAERTKQSYFQSHVYATASIRVWEQMLQTQFYVFERRNQDGTVLSPLVRAHNYFLPSSLQPLVSAVLNTVQLPPAVTRRYRKRSVEGYGPNTPDNSESAADTIKVKPNENAAADESWNPVPGGYCSMMADVGEVCLVNKEVVANPYMISKIYDIGSNVGFPCNYTNGMPMPTLGPSNTFTCPLQPHGTAFGQAVFASLDQYYSLVDLVHFQEFTGVPLNFPYADYGGHNNTAITIESDDKPPEIIDGCQGNPSLCGEANLDMQYMMGVSQYTPTFFIYQNATNTMFVDFLKFVDGFTTTGKTLPWVISISYGGPEDKISPAEIDEFEVFAQKLALSGVSIIAASGDDGANGMNSRTNQEGSYACGYTPDYPATSPSVTAVGALMGPEMGYAEVTCQSNAGGGITSSGGFSGNANLKAADWQKKNIADYFLQLPGYQQAYPGFGQGTRGYPDVSIMGHNYMIILGGSANIEDGTSASSPVFASMISLVNAHRAKQAKPLPPLGFLNPRLYDASSAEFFYDIVEGNNRCAENAETLLTGYLPHTQTPSRGAVYIIAAGCCEQGFYASKGWDPVTGLGSVNFTMMASVLGSDALAPAAAAAVTRRQQEQQRDRGLAAGQPGAPVTTSAAQKTLQPMKAEAEAKGAKLSSPASSVSDGSATQTPHRQADLSARKDIRLLRRASPDSMHKIVLVLAEQRLDELEDALHRISDPITADFGKHWTRQQIAEFTRLPADAQGRSAAQRVKEALLEVGAVLVQTTPDDAIVSAVAPVKVWEHFLKAQFSVYEQSELDGTVSNANLIRCTAYTMPLALQGLVSRIFKTVQFPVPYFKSRRRLSVGQPLDPAVVDTSFRQKNIPGIGGTNVTSQIMPGYVTPKMLLDYYNVKSTDARGYGSIGVFEFFNQTLALLDLSNFQKQFNVSFHTVAPDHIFGRHVNITCGGGNINDCGEANLDVQYITAMVHNTELWYLYTEDFEDGLFQIVHSMPNPPLVISISYGAPEAQIPSDTSEEFRVKVIKLGLMGITVVVSSGDDGVPGSGARPEAGGIAACVYSPQWPASCPYVLAVGASMGPESDRPEVACQSDAGGIVTSGGGFSMTYALPQWQGQAVKGWADQWNGANAPSPWAEPVEGFRADKQYNVRAGVEHEVIGRAYPDVAMLGFNYLVVLGSQVTPVSGTSASAPVFASMVALVNARRLAKGKGPLGWITKALYSPLVKNAGILRDLTYGDNKCTASGSWSFTNGQIVSTTCCNQGYTATQGWDPVTGLGGVKDFEAFASYWEQYTVPPSIAPTPMPLAPTQQPTPVNFDTLFLEPLSRLSGGAIFGILLAVLFPIALAASLGYMWCIGTLPNLSLASFKSWDSFASLFHPSMQSYNAGEARDEIPNPIRSGAGGSPLIARGTATSFGSLSMAGADVEMRESANSFAESRESSWVGANSSSFAGPSGKRL